MNRFRLIRASCGALAALAASQPVLSHACAACYGQSDAPMAHGMNWGIMSLLAVITMVLAGVASFFIYLARRAASVQGVGIQPQMAGATERV